MSKPVLKAALLLLGLVAPLAAADVPRPAPPLRMKTLTGETASLWALRGKVVVVMFFSTDCGYCHAATKILVPLYDELRPRGLEILGLAVNSKAPENLGRFATAFQVEFPLAIASRVDWARLGKFHVSARPPYVPHLLFVDREGNIRAEYRGEKRDFYEDLEARFRAVVEPLLEKAAPEKPASE
jgi:peroxiredoxin